jgi:YggT family protein
LPLRKAPTWFGWEPAYSAPGVIEKRRVVLLGNFVFAIARLLDLAISLYVIVIIIRAILSWFNPNPYGPGMIFLSKITDPVLDRIRRVLPLGGGVGLDLSPIIAIFGLLFIKYFLVASLYDIGAKLK